MEEGIDPYELEEIEPSTDPFEVAAVEVLEAFFDRNKDRVFYGRQLEIIHEKIYFHWVTNRAIRFLSERGIIKREVRRLKWGGNIVLYWHRSFRYYKRGGNSIVALVEKYSEDRVGSSIGGHCELLLVEAFAKSRYTIVGRASQEYGEKKWDKTEHNLDIIAEKDGVGYGVEVKNTLGYIPKEEFDIKMEMCKFLGIRPVFAVRMLPKSWAWEVIRQGGYAMIMEHLLYPEFFSDIASDMKELLQLPVECPKSIADGTMIRFEKWHKKHVNLK